MKKNPPVFQPSFKDLQVVSSRIISGTFSLAQNLGVRLDVNSKLLFLMHILTNVCVVRRMRGVKVSAASAAGEVLYTIVTYSRLASVWQSNAFPGHPEK